MGLCASKENVMTTREVMATLTHIPLFAHLDEIQLSVLAQEFTSSPIGAGEIIFAEGDPGNTLFVIAQGSVRVTASSREGKALFLAEWPSPMAFGEIALLRDASRRTASVHTGTGGVLLSLTKPRFGRLAQRFSWMEAVTHRMGSVANHRMAMFLKDIPFLSLIDDRQLDTLGALFSYERANAGEAICTEGEPGDKFYILSKGTVAVTTADTALVSLNEGAHFGEMALLSNTPRTATVTATDTCMLLSLPREAFINFLAVVPQARAHLQTMMRTRAAANLRGLSCPVFQGMSDGQLSLLAKLCASKAFSAGDIIVRQGDPVPAFLVLVHGTADAFVDPALAATMAAAEGRRGDAAIMDPTARPAPQAAPTPGHDDSDDNDDDDADDEDGAADTAVGEGAASAADRVSFAKAGGFLGALRSKSRTRAATFGRRVAVLSAGSYHGETSLLFDLPATCTLVAKEDLTVLRFPRPLFRQIFAANASAAAEFLLRIDPGAACLEITLVHAAARSLFMEHLKGEFSAESLEFFFESQRLIDNHLASAEVVLTRAKEITDKYVRNGSPRQVNIKDKARRNVEKTLAETTEVTMFPACLWASRLFFDARLELFKLMDRDSFPRFKDGPLFARLLVTNRAYILSQPLPGVPSPTPTPLPPAASPSARPASTPAGPGATRITLPSAAAGADAVSRSGARRASTGATTGATRLTPGVPLLAPQLALLPPSRLGLSGPDGGASEAGRSGVQRAASFSAGTLRRSADPAPNSDTSNDAAPSANVVRTRTIDGGLFASAARQAARVVLGLRAPRASGATPRPSADPVRATVRRSSSVPSLENPEAERVAVPSRIGTRLRGNTVSTSVRGGGKLELAQV